MELRKGRRAPLQLSASFTCDESTGTGVIYNLSKEGCAIESQTYVPVNSYIQIEVQVSSDESPVLVELAVIRWSTRTGFGAEFLTVREEGRNRLLEYIEART